MKYYTFYQMTVNDQPEEIKNKIIKEFREASPDAKLSISEQGYGNSVKGYEIVEEFEEFCHRYPDVHITLFGDGEESGDQWRRDWYYGTMHVSTMKEAEFMFPYIQDEEFLAKELITTFADKSLREALPVIKEFVTNYLETFYQFSILLEEKAHEEGTKIYNEFHETGGRGYLWKTAQQLTSGFEKENKGRDWADSDYFEAIEQYFHNFLNN